MTAQRKPLWILSVGLLFSFLCTCSYRSVHGHTSHCLQVFVVVVVFCTTHWVPKKIHHHLQDHWSDPSASHRRHRCILSLSLCTHTWHFLRAPVNMFNNTSSGTHLTTHADIIAIGHASAPVSHRIVEQTGFKAAWDICCLVPEWETHLVSQLCLSCFQVAVVTVKAAIDVNSTVRGVLGYCRPQHCADKCSRLQIKKLSFSFLFLVSVQSRKIKQIRIEAKERGTRK